MIGRHHDERLSIPARPVEDGLEGGIELQYFGNRGCGIIVMAGVVDAASFDHQEEAVRVAGKAVQRHPGHGRKRWLRIVTVKNIAHVRWAEETEQTPGIGTLEFRAVGDNVESIGSGLRQEIALVLMGGGRQGMELPAASAQEKIDTTRQHLRRNLILLVPTDVVRAKAGRRGVGDPAGGHQSGAHASGFGGFQDGPPRNAGTVHGNGAVESHQTAGQRRCRRRRIGHPRIKGRRSGTPDKIRVEHQVPAGHGPGQRGVGGAEAVTDQEDQVSWREGAGRGDWSRLGCR